SRRRHTRFSRDWSSACALPIYPRLFVREADLPEIRSHLQTGEVKEAWEHVQTVARRDITGELPTPAGTATNYDESIMQVIDANRSEERRVGKENRPQGRHHSAR